MEQHPTPEEESSLQPLGKLEQGKIVFSLLFLVLLLSQGKLDPTPINEVMPPMGVENWFGLAGSLFAGFFLDLWGHSSFLIPLVLLCFVKKESKSVVGEFIFILLSVSNLSLFFSLALPLQPSELQAEVGLFGMSARANLIGAPLFWPALGVSFAFLIRMGLAFRLNSNLFSLVLYKIKDTKAMGSLLTHGLQPLIQQTMILFSPFVELYYSLKSKDQKKIEKMQAPVSTRQEELMKDALQAYQQKKKQP